jgi:hypothetical protein
MLRDIDWAEENSVGWNVFDELQEVLLFFE